MADKKKMRLLATYFRHPDSEGRMRSLVQGDEFEADEATAERLIKAGAAEEAKSGTKGAGGGDGDEKVEDPPPTDPPPTDPAGKPKPTPRGAK